MIEKNVSYNSFQKKIVPYLDGSLSKEETAEFEAFVLTHPEFENKIKEKRDELETIRAMIPAGLLTKESQESMESEMRTSIYNLIKEEPRGFMDTVRIKWEDFLNN